MSATPTTIHLAQPIPQPQQKSTKLQLKSHHLFTTWSSTYSCLPYRIIYPTCEEDIKWLLDLCHKTKRKLRVIGSGLSSSDICLTQDFMVDLKKMNSIIEVSLSLLLF